MTFPKSKAIAAKCAQAGVAVKFVDNTESYPKRAGEFVWVYNEGTPEFDDLQMKGSYNLFCYCGLVVSSH